MTPFQATLRVVGALLVGTAFLAFASRVLTAQGDGGVSTLLIALVVAACVIFVAFVCVERMVEPDDGRRPRADD